MSHRNGNPTPAVLLTALTLLFITVWRQDDGLNAPVMVRNERRTHHGRVLAVAETTLQGAVTVSAWRPMPPLRQPLRQAVVAVVGRGAAEVPVLTAGRLSLQLAAVSTRDGGRALPTSPTAALPADWWLRLWQR